MSRYKEVTELLKNGAVGLLPSDTIYGISCLALNKNAVERVYNLKGRDYDKPLIILLADIEQAEKLGIDREELQPVRRLWPAPLTVVVRAGQNTPEFLHRGTETLAVRLPDDKKLHKLIKQVGPIVSTSANPQGKEPAKTVKQAKVYFGDKLDFYVDTGKLKTPSSTLATIRGNKLQVIRQGAYKVPADKLY